MEPPAYVATDHTAAMRAGLIGQFKGLPNIDAFIKAFGAQLNDLDEYFGQLLTQLILPNAEGVQLDKIGDVLDQGRNGLGDDDYKTLLQARIIQYQSMGTAEDLIQLLLTLAGTNRVDNYENFPAKITLIARSPATAISNADIITAVQEAKAVGVGVNLNQGNIPIFQFDLAATAANAGFDQGHLAGPLI